MMKPMETASLGMYINDAEFFWGTTDPGEGNGISMLPIDRPVTLFSEYFILLHFCLIGQEIQVQ